MSGLPAEKVEEYHQRFSKDPVYQQVYKEVCAEVPYHAAPYVNRESVAVRFYLLLDNAICWNTTCLNCARMLDSSIVQFEELEAAKRELKTMRSEIKSVILRLTHFAR